MPGSKAYSLAYTLRNPLARMLPLQREQMQVYRLGEKKPPAGSMLDHGPMWEAVSFVLGPLKTSQARVNLQRDFTLLAITAVASSVAAGGFRAQFYDKKKDLRLADRGVQQANLAGTTGGAAFLREPYQFDLPDSQILVIVQNLESVANTIQIALYGQVLRFNQPHPDANEFPGGPVTSWPITGGGQ
jgi:hypothetical protein